jgi:hypothetical protein
LDVPRRSLDRWIWWIAIGALVALGIVLRLRGLHNPILDHPGWRQGDTAAIARNFATLQLNPLYPQTDYNGPPPNYVELELQIVPFLAAIGYKLFGVHEVFGRLISLGFSVGTIVVLAFFGRWLIGTIAGGLIAAAIFTVLPGSVYYGRTFMPDTTMVFFFTLALFVCTRYLVDGAKTWRGAAWAALALAMAFLAKPVAVVALVPLVAVAAWEFRKKTFGTSGLARIGATVVAALIVLLVYGQIVSSHAEWHWASGITKLHVIPALKKAFTSPVEFVAKLRAFKDTYGLISKTMLGFLGVLILVLGFTRRLRTRSDALLYGWLLGYMFYAYAVLTVERVDYYTYIILPLAALVGGALFSYWIERLRTVNNARVLLTGLALAGTFLLVAFIVDERRTLAPYYNYKKANYIAAKALDATLPPDALVVMAHYDPSILYYINRKGWEEDPYLWTPFDEQSAIRKGSRYFIAIENNRFKRNVELYAWMQRFPVRNPDAMWPLYETDPAKILPGAEERWQAFRRKEKAGLLEPASGPPVPKS